VYNTDITNVIQVGILIIVILIISIVLLRLFSLCSVERTSSCDRQSIFSLYSQLFDPSKAGRQSLMHGCSRTPIVFLSVEQSLRRIN